MMFMSIFETKILLCVDSTFGNLKLFSPLIDIVFPTDNH